MKNRLLKLIMALTLSVSCILPMIACGEDDDEDSYDPTKSNITLWCQIPQADFFGKVEKLFEKAYPNINLIVSPQPESNLGSSLDATLGGNNGPDITSTYGGLIGSTLVKSSRIVDIDDIIKPLESNLAGGAKTNKIDGNGKYYTAPLHGFASPVVFYNKDMFEAMKNSSKLNNDQKAAIKEPETYNDLKNLCSAILAYGKKTIVGAFSTFHLPHFMQAMHSRTMSVEDYAKLLDKTATPNPYDTQGFEDGFKLLRRYYDDKILDDNITSYTTDSIDTLFINESSPLRLGVSLDYTALNDNCTFEIGAFYLPVEETNSNAPRANSVYGDVLAISAKSKNIEASKTFISYVMKAEIQALLADSSLFPARTDANIEDKFSSTLEKLFNELANGSNDFYQSWSYSGTDLQLLYEGQKVLKATGDTNIASAISSARNTLKNYFAEAQQI